MGRPNSCSAPANIGIRRDRAVHFVAPVMRFFLCLLSSPCVFLGPLREVVVEEEEEVVVAPEIIFGG